MRRTAILSNMGTLLLNANLTFHFSAGNDSNPFINDMHHRHDIATYLTSKKNPETGMTRIASLICREYTYMDDGIEKKTALNQR